MPKVYAVALSAENAARHEVVSGSILADNQPEAKELGVQEAIKRWPPNNGWTKHACSAGEVPPVVPAQPVTLGDDVTGRDRVVVNIVDRLSKADPSKIQEIAASQVELLTIYHNVVLEQAQRSFKWALIAAGVGLGFFLAAVGFMLLQQSQNIANISLISGALVEVISAINFYLYGKTAIQMADFESRLDHTQRFLLANSVCEGLDGDYKQQTRAALVHAIAGFEIEPLMIHTGAGSKETKKS